MFGIHVFHIYITLLVVVQLESRTLSMLRMSYAWQLFIYDEPEIKLELAEASVKYTQVI